MLSWTGRCDEHPPPKKKPPSMSHSSHVPANATARSPANFFFLSKAAMARNKGKISEGIRNGGAVNPLNWRT